jgi:hypothetical protein
MDKEETIEPSLSRREFSQIWPLCVPFPIGIRCKDDSQYSEKTALVKGNIGKSRPSPFSPSK